MTDQKPTGEPQPFFAAELMPHRSLSPKGFAILMLSVAFVSFIAGGYFYAVGAWPVLGFFGLDVLIIYVAFKLNYRAARLRERIDIWPNRLLVRRMSPRGEITVWTYNPYWTQVGLEADRHGGVMLSIGSHGQHVEIGNFLSDDEKRSLAARLGEVLHNLRSSRPD